MDGGEGKVASESLPTLFHTLLHADVPPEEKGEERLTHEIYTVVGAGTETTSTTLALVTYHLLANPAILAKLRTELREASTRKTDSIPLRQLEQLPYLVGQNAGAAAKHVTC
jgi:cytochrome P450